MATAAPASGQTKAKKKPAKKPFIAHLESEQKVRQRSVMRP
jgi:hypothetical protein